MATSARFFTIWLSLFRFEEFMPACTRAWNVSGNLLGDNKNMVAKMILNCCVPKKNGHPWPLKKMQKQCVY
jgi:hypothetical protein